MSFQNKTELPFWERPETVEMFASRPPDKRMMAWLASKPKSTSVLDLGCAGGRNSAWLAEQGFDVYAVDTSDAMLAKTRERIAETCGQEEAFKRVVKSAMRSLPFEAEFFDLIVALGVIQGAQSEPEWHETVAGLVRILKPAGHILISAFTPNSDPTGEGMALVAGEKHIYQSPLNQRRMLLLELAELDAWMAQHGLEPVIASSSVFVESADRHHTTANARYKKLRDG